MNISGLEVGEEDGCINDERVIFTLGYKVEKRKIFWDKMP